MSCQPARLAGFVAVAHQGVECAPVSVRTVGICETQPLTVEGLRSLLASRPGFRLVGSVSTLDALPELVRSARPDLLILDKALGVTAILEQLAELRVYGAIPACIVWGASLSEPEALRLLQAGARGIIRKNAEPQLVFTCIESVAAGSNWVEDCVFRDGPRNNGRYPRSELTPRERQVMELIEQGLKNKEIARDLGIRPGTVKIHLKHIFEKTGVRGRYGLALTGLKNKGLLNLPD